ncbi:MAG: MFS transporter, partial [Clostridia bacterium]|nr:MFS transporter [Clostridia bacterium]
LDCVMTFFGSTANDAAFNAWLTDSADQKKRGAAEGINAMMPLLAILVVFGGFMFFDLNREESWSLIFCIIGGAVCLVGLLGAILLREPRIAPSRDSYRTALLYGFMPKTVKGNPALYAHLLAFVFFNVAIQIFMPYLILYYEVSLGMTDYVFIMAPPSFLPPCLPLFGERSTTKRAFASPGFGPQGFSFSAS